MDERLVEIQKGREKKSLTSFQRSNRKLKEAEKVYEKANDEWKNYREWRRGESDKMFEDMKEKKLPLKDLQAYNTRLADWKFKETNLEQTQAKKLIEKNVAKNDKVEARKDLTGKQIKHEKYKKIFSKYDQINKKEIQRKDNNEEEETNESISHGNKLT